MQIGICGVQGVGKSTLAKALSQRLKLPLITEQARDAAQVMGITNLKELRGNQNSANDYQRLCLKLQLEKEKDCGDKGFVSDRTTIDNAAYWLKWHSHKAS